MLKKSIYISVTIVFIYFIYTIFFKDISDVNAPIIKEMKAKNVTYYLKDEAIIYAKEQIGSNEDKYIKFNDVIIDFTKKDMIMKADFGEVNTELLEVLLQGNVEGKTKDNKWNLATQSLNYTKDENKIFSNERTKVSKIDEGVELEGDKIRTTTKFHEIVGDGNVVYKKESRIITADSMKYFDLQQKVELNGNVKYVDEATKIEADKTIYFIENRQVEATGNVKYASENLKVNGRHIFHDDKNEIVKMNQSGNFVYLPRNSSGNFINAEYNIKKEILKTTNNFTLNYDEYKLAGKDVIYEMNSGNVEFNEEFSIFKENIKISGLKGYMNTNEKNIFAENIELTSVQGDKITAKSGGGSFEKREFSFSKNVRGKIRSNVKEVFSNLEELVENDSIQFEGDNAKIYFLIHKNNNMSITRSELKENVVMKYRNMQLKSEYNEIDTSKNLILARDKIIVDLNNEIQMTSNFLYYNLNKEEGTAQNNVKIVSFSPKYSHINMSSKKAEINMKTRKIKLIGDVTTYQGKNKTISSTAIYDIDKGVLHNNDNIQLKYEITKKDEKNNKKSEQNNIDAINNVLDELTIDENLINDGKNLILIKEKMAKNGVIVKLKWTSSNNSYLTSNGNVNKSYYGGKSKTVDLKVEASVGIDKKEKIFKLVIPSETVEEMLERASKNINFKNREKSIFVNINNGIIEIPIIWDKNEVILKFDGKEYKKYISF